MSSTTQEREGEEAAVTELRAKVNEYINATDDVTVEGMMRPGNPPYLTDGTNVSKQTHFDL